MHTLHCCICLGRRGAVSGANLATQLPFLLRRRRRLLLLLLLRGPDTRARMPPDAPACPPLPLPGTPAADRLGCMTRPGFDGSKTEQADLTEPRPAAAIRLLQSTRCPVCAAACRLEHTAPAEEPLPSPHAACRDTQHSQPPPRGAVQLHVFRGSTRQGS